MAVETVQLTDGALFGIAASEGEHRRTLARSQSVKLGRRSPPSRPRGLRFGTYLEAEGTPPPRVVDYAAKAMPALQRMYLNDQFGDCVIAGKYHAEGVWSANDSASPVTGIDQEVYDAYQTICGPGDRGCVITEVLDYYRDKGLRFNGTTRKIDGYASIDWTSKREVQVALYLFGAVTLGIHLPDDWTRSAVWDVTRSPLVGDHDVTAIGYNEQGVQVSSWGRIYTITWAAFLSRTWLEEAYVMLAPDWYGNDSLAPCGVDAGTLKSDLAQFASGTIPPIDPTPAPGPIPLAAPNYVGSLQGTMSGPFGSHPFNGTLSLHPVATQAEMSMPTATLNWLAIFGDLMSLIAAIRGRSVPAIIIAIEKLAGDLGIAIPPVPVP